jgi:TonB family protein
MIGSGNQMKAAILLLITAVSLRPQEISHTSDPKPIHVVRAQYTNEALAAKIEGDVILSLLVGSDGVPSDIKVVRGLGMGLDEKAVECLQQWRFKRATNYFGESAFAKATVRINFRLPRPPFRIPAPSK